MPITCVGQSNLEIEIWQDSPGALAQLCGTSIGVGATSQVNWGMPL